MKPNICYLTIALVIVHLVFHVVAGAFRWYDIMHPFFPIPFWTYPLGPCVLLIIACIFLSRRGRTRYIGYWFLILSGWTFLASFAWTPYYPPNRNYSYVLSAIIIISTIVSLGYWLSEILMDRETRGQLALAS